MDESPVTSPTNRPECPLLVVTGPTSLVSSSSLTRKRVSDTEQRSQRHHDDDGHLASPEMTSRDDTEGGALSDGEVDRRTTTNHRIIRNRFTSQVQRTSVFYTDSDISHIDVTLHKQLRASDSLPVSKFGTVPRKRTDSKRPSRRISCKDLGSGLCKGWLMKKREGAKRKTWVKRWFVLSRRSLFYYKTEEDVKAEGVIYLPGFKISPAPEIKNKKFAFKAHHSGTTFYFAAERQDDMAKWMNKLGLASLDDLELSDRALTAGFWKPPEMLPQVKSASYQDLTGVECKSSDCYCSETDDDDNLSHNVSPASPTSYSNSKDDITALYRNIERAELDIAGSNVRDRRSTMLLSVLSDSESRQRDDMWRHLLSLNRTLKDQQQTLAVIDALLHQQPITSQHLADFVHQHPDVVGQQGSKDDVSQDVSDDSWLTVGDSEQPSDSVLSDSVLSDSADTSTDTTATCRHLSQSSGPMTSPTLLSPPSDDTRHSKPRRPSQETSV